MVTKGELGRPVERLWEQMEKLQLHSAKVVMLEQQLAMAEERVRRLEEEKQGRAKQAETSVSMILYKSYELLVYSSPIFTLTFILLIHYREFHHILLYKLFTYSKELRLRIKILMH